MLEYGNNQCINQLSLDDSAAECARQMVKSTVDRYNCGKLVTGVEAEIRGTVKITGKGVNRWERGATLQMPLLFDYLLPLLSMCPSDGWTDKSPLSYKYLFLGRGFHKNHPANLSRVGFVVLAGFLQGLCKLSKPFSMSEPHQGLAVPKLA